MENQIDNGYALEILKLKLVALNADLEAYKIWYRDTLNKSDAEYEEHVDVIRWKANKISVENAIAKLVCSQLSSIELIN